MSLIPAIKQVLREENLPLVEDISNENAVSGVLDGQGASIVEACGKISHLMNYGEDEKLQFRAAREILDLHGVRDKGHGEKIPQLVIVGDSASINAIYIPRPTLHSTPSIDIPTLQEEINHGGS
jgi:hypothetical protein